MTEDVAGPESDHSHVALILLRGVEDLPDNVSGWIAGSLDATPFNSDWKNPENNDFAIAEEVTVLNEREKRPDIVIYVNGIEIYVHIYGNTTTYRDTIYY